MRRRIYLKEAIEATATENYPGTKTALAALLGISKQAISQWNPRKPLAKRHVNKLKEFDPMKFGNRE